MGCCVNENYINENYIIREYRNHMLNHMTKVFSNIDKSELNNIIEEQIMNNLNNPEVNLVNSYKGRQATTNLVDLGNYIEKSKPILLPSGVLFKNHDSDVKPVLPSIFGHYINERNIKKKKMFTFQEGTYEYELYDLLQLLAKIDANALYGLMGLDVSIIFNYDIASSVTLTGRGLISIAGCQIEMFLNNNVKFDSMGDIINLFEDVNNDFNSKHPTFFRDNNIIIDIYQCMDKLLKTCENNITGWYPNDSEKEYIYSYLFNSGQEFINRVYYKNNLFGFMEIPFISDLLIQIYTKMETPYVNPYNPPEEIKPTLDYLYELIYDYVYYKRIIDNSIFKYSNMMRSVNIITDTDSCIVCFNNWLKLVNKIVSGHNMKHEAKYIPYHKLYDGELRGFSKMEFPYRFNFKENKIEENEKKIPFLNFKNSDGHRFGLLNIGSYILGNIINDYVERYVYNANAFITDGDAHCLMKLKNEFLMKTILLTDAKKLYSSIIELREGNIENNKLDIKGLQIAKSTSNKRIRNDLQNLLYHLILNTDTVDYHEVIEQLSVLKETLKQSLQNKEKDYYNPLKVKSISSYDNPYSTQGVRGMILWNVLKDDEQPPFDLEELNYLDSLKVKIDPELLKQRYPEKYNKLANFLENDKDFIPKGNSSKGYNVDKAIKEINNISVPKNATIPDFLVDFIDYNTVIDNNLSKLPIEYIGIYKREAVPYTNIIKL